MIKQTSTNPLANLLVIAAGIIVIGVSVVLGFFAFVVLAAVISVAAAALGIRIWWFNRRLNKKAGATRGTVQQQGTADVIDGEYHVVGEDGDKA